MSIRIIRKSTRRRRKVRPRVALVLAGGAISGGAFKLGGLIALNRYLKNRKVTDFELYQGISAGAFLAAPIAAGIPPEEILKAMHGTSRRISRFRLTDFYYPNWREAGAKLGKLGRDAASFYPGLVANVIRHLAANSGELVHLLERLAEQPTTDNLEALLLPIIQEATQRSDLPYPSTYIPGGLFDNSTIERFVRKNFERNRLPNSFRLLKHGRGRSLYIAATSLDTAKEATFGPGMREDLTISEAVQASTALPLFYKPARIHGEDFLDAAVRRTAGVTFTANALGADFIICYNPFRPFKFSDAEAVARHHEHLGDLGIFWILNQAIRSMLHSRLELGIRVIERDPSFKGDLIVIEPRESDAQFFTINPVAFWKRAVSAEHGFSTTKADLEELHPELEDLFRQYNIEVDLTHLRRSGEQLAEARYDDRAILNLLEEPSFSRRLRWRA